MPSVTAVRFLTRALKQSHPARMLTLKSNTNICTNCKVNINDVCCFLFVTRVNSPHQHEHTHTHTAYNIKPFLMKAAKERVREHM